MCYIFIVGVALILIHGYDTIFYFYVSVAFTDLKKNPVNCKNEKFSCSSLKNEYVWLKNILCL